MTFRTLGVDPGKSGAVALLADSEWEQVFDMPVKDNRVDQSALLELFIKLDPDLVVIEKVHSMPTDGKASAFAFGVAVGTVIGAAAAWDIDQVSPQVWMRAAGLLGRPKDDARAKAVERWPLMAGQVSRKKDVGRAEAAFIGLYGYAKH